MQSDLYSIVALGMRYVFCGLILLIVFRAWRITVVDNRRARILRMLMPDVASVGEFISQGTAGGKRRGRYLIPREGVLGASGGADITIRHPDVRRKHAFFELREGGLLIRPLKGGNIMLENGANARQLILRDGDTILLGKLRLTLVLFDASTRSRDMVKAPEPDSARMDEFFEVEGPWEEQREWKKPRAK